MRKKGMIVGAIISIIGFMLFTILHQGFIFPFNYSIYDYLGLIMLIVGNFVLGVSTGMPSSKPTPYTTRSFISREATEIVKIRCTKCGKLNEKEARFCNNCGSPLMPKSMDESSHNI